MSLSLAPINPENPALLGYPPTLPIEIAMRTAPIKQICEAYGIDKDEWERLREHPIFVADVKAAAETLKEEGMSFTFKARMQAEELLKTSWQMIQNVTTPPTVRADLIKFTIRAAGLDKSAQKEQAQQGFAPQLNIQINLG
jgi:cytochrome P450